MANIMTVIISDWKDNLSEISYAEHNMKESEGFFVKNVVVPLMDCKISNALDFLQVSD